MSYVGAKTETILAQHITVGIFFCTFLNTGWLIVLSNANLEYYGLSFLNGKYSDFNTDWYLITGDIIIQTMMINAFVPSIIIGVNFIRFKVQIVWDEWEKKDNHSETLHTKKKSI